MKIWEEVVSEFFGDGNSATVADWNGNSENTYKKQVMNIVLKLCNFPIAVVMMLVSIT